MGVYHVAELAGNFQYLDAMTLDTPILAPSARACLANVHTIADRLTRCAHFVDYLDSQWHSSNLPGDTFDWIISSDRAKAEISRIQASLLRS